MDMNATRQQGIGQGEIGQQPVTLVIPCRAEYIGLCRLVAGVLGVRGGLGEEDVADLKVVVTEACTCFLWGPDGPPLSDEGATPVDQPCMLRIDFTVSPGSWELTISDPDRRYRLPHSHHCTARGEDGLGLTIMNALVDSLEHTDTEADGSVIRVGKRLLEEQAPAE
jgi:anti-sigma regulatory factor (Ser/Thr protein kinase)